MNISKLTIEKETEKAICVIVALKHNDNGEHMFVDGKSGFFKKVTAWFPKSQIKDGEVPAWLVASKKQELREYGYRFNITDIVYI